jgi:hypothetical protein
LRILEEIARQAGFAGCGRSAGKGGSGGSGGLGGGEPSRAPVDGFLRKLGRQHVIS